jgi:serine protease
MRKYQLLTGLWMAAFALFSTHASHDFIIKFKNNVSSRSLLQSNFNQLGLKVKTVVPLAGGALQIVFKTDSGRQFVDEQMLLKKINQVWDVDYAVLNRRGQFKPLPELPETNTPVELTHALQWDEFAIPQGMFLESTPGRLDGAWAYSLGDAQKEVVVAVLDTGIEKHPDLLHALFRTEKGDLYGWNFADGNRNLADDTHSYHGTHVAGTIVANGQVINGIGPRLRLVPVKIPAANGMFYESNVGLPCSRCMMFRSDTFCHSISFCFTDIEGMTNRVKPFLAAKTALFASTIP